MPIPIPRVPALCVALIALSPAALAVPPAASNQAALARSFALPALGQTMRAPGGAGAWHWVLDLSNEYVLEQDGDEELLLDGESLRYAFGYGRSWGERGDWQVEVPVLNVEGGFGDDLIEGWHDIFSLPNGGREKAPQDRFLYRYLRDGVRLLEVDDGGTTLGDVLLSAGWQWGEGLMLRGQLKLPTGDEDKLAGGNAGVAAWADYALPFSAGSGASGYLSAGLSINDESDVLADLQNQVIPFGGLGVGYRLFGAFELFAQVYAHTALFEDTEIGALQRPGVQLTLGARHCSASGLCLELSFQEDPAVGVSPDFGLRFAVSSR